MRKFQIFLFIEACLLTGALIMMVSEHFSRFLLILLLFLLVWESPSFFKLPDLSF